MARLLLVLFFVSLPLVASRVADVRAGAPRIYDARTLPAELVSHRMVEEQPLAPDIEAMLAPESYSMRLYSDGHGSVVWLYFALYSGIGTSGAHDPGVCYPAQGWDAGAPVEKDLPLADGSRMAVKLLGATQGGKEERVLYWFQPADRWPTLTPREPLLRIADGLAGRPQYGFVRLSVHVPLASVEAQRAAEAKLEELAIALAPAVRLAVTGPTVTAQP